MNFNGHNACITTMHYQTLTQSLMLEENIPMKEASIHSTGDTMSHNELDVELGESYDA